MKKAIVCLIFVLLLSGMFCRINASTQSQSVNCRLVKSDASAQKASITSQNGNIIIYWVQQSRSDKNYIIKALDERTGSYKNVTSQGTFNFENSKVSWTIPASKGFRDFEPPIIAPEPLQPPVFCPNPGDYNFGVMMTITCASENVTIYYTTDGTDPSRDSKVYNSPFFIPTTTTLKAFSHDNKDNKETEVVQGVYNINLAAPIFSPEPGNYTFGRTIDISCGIGNVTIYYTTDGTTPTVNSDVYETPFFIPTTTTVKAFVHDNETGINNPVTSATYNITTPANFVLVGGGTFYNGTSNVTVSSFYIDKYELSQENYVSIMGQNPSDFIGSNNPVEMVSWFNAIEYCNKRSISENLIPCYTYSGFGTNPENWPSGWNTNDDNHINVSCNWTANGYRLLTEAEWQFAARGGNQTHNYNYSGSYIIGDVTWYCQNSLNYTHPIGTKSANELGIYDMSGNVWEWVWDRNGGYPAGPQNNPHGSDVGSNRVKRGGSFNYDSVECTVFYRAFTYPRVTFNWIGFRICKRTN